MLCHVERDRNELAAIALHQAQDRQPQEPLTAWDLDVLLRQLKGLRAPFNREPEAYALERKVRQWLDEDNRRELITLLWRAHIVNHDLHVRAVTAESRVTGLAREVDGLQAQLARLGDRQALKDELLDAERRADDLVSTAKTLAHYKAAAKRGWHHVCSLDLSVRWSIACSRPGLNLSSRQSR